MFKELKKKLYFEKMEVLFTRGILEEKITHFDEELYSKMNNVYFNCIPISMHIKYLRPTTPPGKCYDRSLFMFFCFDDALLVRGDVKDLELNYGKARAGHGWIEIGDYVYDPSKLLKFDKELYYKIYSPTNVHKISKDEYNKNTNNYYDEIRNTKLEDFQIDGSKRTDLAVTIPIIKAITEVSDDIEFKKDLEEYLKLIQYDEKQIEEKLKSYVKNLTLK